MSVYVYLKYHIMVHGDTKFDESCLSQLHIIVSLSNQIYLMYLSDFVYIKYYSTMHAYYMYK